MAVPRGVKPAASTRPPDRGLAPAQGRGDHAGMHVAFVVHVVKGADIENILSEGTKRETQAVVMSLEDAKKMGFGASGITAPPDRDVCLIIVAKRDAPWITRTLEGSETVAGFQMVDVEIG
jgi:hypothetical protein